MIAIDRGQFTLPGYRSSLMQADDLTKLKSLLEKCADYSLMVTGSPPKSSDAASLLADCPEGKTLADKFLIGISTRKQELIGVLDAIRDYPTQHDWWLGLLLLDPAQRNKGLGTRIFKSFEYWLRQQGTRHVFLGVVEENQRAYQFWQGMGFQVVERQPARLFGNLYHVVLTMVYTLSER
jgi:GNAT superfamily N-acetyltransferase